MDLAKPRGTGLLRSPVSSPEPPLPQVSAEGRVRVDQLISLVDGISLCDSTISSKAQEPYLSWYQEAKLDESTIHYAVEKLHQYWLSSPSAVVKAAVFLCANLMSQTDEKKLLRSMLLSCLEKDFENRQDMQAKSPEKFINSAAFLVEVYIRVRIEKRPWNIMTTPVFQYLEDLLTGDDSEIKLFAHLVIGIGPTLKEIQSMDGKSSSLTFYSPLQNLFLKVRSTLMSRNLSSQSRAWLLFIMDISSTGDYDLPSPSLQMFYKDNECLGAAGDDFLKSLGNIKSSEGFSPESCMPNKNEDVGVVNKIANIQVSTDIQAKQETEKEYNPGLKKMSPGKNDQIDKRENFRIALDITETRDKQETEREHNPGLKKMGPSNNDNFHKRENLRSALDITDTRDTQETDKGYNSGLKKKIPGKNDHLDKRDNFRSALDMNKGGKAKSYWLHDDRFEKDDSYGSHKKDRSVDSFNKPRASQNNWRQSNDEKEGKTATSDSNWRQPISNESSRNRQHQTREGPQPSSGPTSAKVTNKNCHSTSQVQEECWD